MSRARHVVEKQFATWRRRARLGIFRTPRLGGALRVGGVRLNRASGAGRKAETRSDPFSEADVLAALTRSRMPAEFDALNALMDEA